MTTFELYLPSVLSDCPWVWQKFIASMDHTDDLWYRIEQIKRSLKEFEAEVIFVEGSISMITFSDEKYWTIFSLKFG